jgi:hypothetical protein
MSVTDGESFHFRNAGSSFRSRSYGTVARNKFTDTRYRSEGNFLRPRSKNDGDNNELRYSDHIVLQDYTQEAHIILFDKHSF